MKRPYIINDKYYIIYPFISHLIYISHSLVTITPPLFQINHCLLPGKLYRGHYFNFLVLKLAYRKSL